eukprot:scaffold7242_cov400-Prasinococcus_capsulatus_cf.AAC.9
MEMRRATLGFEVGLFITLPDYTQQLTLTVNPGPLGTKEQSATQQQTPGQPAEEGLVAIEEAGDKAREDNPSNKQYNLQGQRVISVRARKVMVTFQLIGFVTMFVSPPFYISQVFRAIFLVVPLCFLHASFRKPSVGSAFERLKNAETKEDVEWAVRNIASEVKNGLLAWHLGMAANAYTHALALRDGRVSSAKGKEGPNRRYVACE